MLLGVAGRRAPTLPDGVDIADLDLETLQAGDTQRGRAGDTVFTAVPLSPVRRSHARCSCSPSRSNTRPFGDSGRVVLLAAVLALDRRRRSSPRTWPGA